MHIAQTMHNNTVHDMVYTQISELHNKKRKNRRGMRGRGEGDWGYVIGMGQIGQDWTCGCVYFVNECIHSFFENVYM